MSVHSSVITWINFHWLFATYFKYGLGSYLPTLKRVLALPVYSWANSFIVYLLVRHILTEITPIEMIVEYTVTWVYFLLLYSSSTPLCWAKQLFSFGWRTGQQGFVCCKIILYQPSFSYTIRYLLWRKYIFKVK